MKRIISLILALTLVMVMLVPFVSAADFVDNRVKYGDVNNDGGINLRDCVTLLRHLAGWEIEERVFNAEAADVTHDDKLNLHDATKLLRYLAKWHLEHGLDK